MSVSLRTTMHRTRKLVTARTPCSLKLSILDGRSICVLGVEKCGRCASDDKRDESHCEFCKQQGIVQRSSDLEVVKSPVYWGNRIPMAVDIRSRVDYLSRHWMHVDLDALCHAPDFVL
jgi:hypothetical protein